MAEGIDGLLHNATRPSRKKPLTAATIEQVVAMTLAEPPGEATHWTGRSRRGQPSRRAEDLGGARSEAASGGVTAGAILPRSAVR